MHTLVWGSTVPNNGHSMFMSAAWKPENGEIDVIWAFIGGKCPTFETGI